MEVEPKSDWMVNQIELMKAIHGYEREGINEEIGSIDYVASGDGQGEKLLRVIPEPEPNPSRVYFEMTTRIVESLEKEDYDEVVIMAEDFTDASKKLLREENIEYMTPDTRPRYSIFELIDAIHRVTYELCRAKCGRVPMSEVDCEGYQPSVRKGHQAGKYTCPVRLISDNADFHAERGWKWLLKKDFSQLVTLRKEVNE